VCKILADHAVKPHKSLPSRRRGVRYYLEKRDPGIRAQDGGNLCIYRQVAVLRERGQGA
jgi:hypothetical protein